MKTTEQQCTLCIIGAGYAGLNALYAAKSYLGPQDRVIVIDKRHGWGGQWLEQYDFVRLHQPYQHFTAGNKPWALQRNREYLASKAEVLGHLSDIAQECEESLQLLPLWGHAYQSHTVVNGQVEIIVQAISQSANSESETIRIKASKLINAVGFNIPILKPFPVSSSQVKSISVVDSQIHQAPMHNDTRPVYIIGSGKTAMDCAHTIITNDKTPNRKLVMIGGRGTLFAKRETAFPTGWRRNTYGASKVFSDRFTRAITRYDGSNEKEVYQHLRDDGFIHSLVPDSENFIFGLVSEEEMTVIREGITEVHRGHLLDIVDNPDGRILLELERDGQKEKMEIEPNAWVINCTSHLRDFKILPILSEDGLVCCPQRFLVFSGPSHFIATHLFFLGKLQGCWRRLRRVTFEAEPRSELGARMMVLYLANLSEIIFQVPLRVLLTMKADFNQWFPLHRRVFAILRLLLNRSWLRRKGREVLLDTYETDT